MVVIMSFVSAGEETDSWELYSWSSTKRLTRGNSNLKLSCGSPNISKPGQTYVTILTPSLITKSSSLDNSTYQLTIKSTRSPQVAARNSFLWVSYSSCYWLCSHSEVLRKNALPNWSRSPAIFSHIQGWAFHLLSGYCPKVTGLLEAALRSCVLHCLYPPLLLFPFPSSPSVQLSLMSLLWPSEARNSALPNSQLHVLQSQVD